MEQLTFELAPAEPPSFANFLAGPNAEAVTALRHLARGEVRETCVLIWGAPGSGRTHLMHAVVAAAQALPAAVYHAGPASAPAEPPGPGALVAIDDVDGAEGIDRGGDELVGGLGLGQVTGVDRGFTVDLTGCLLGDVGVEVIDQYLGALGGEELGGRPANSSCRTGDDCRFPIKKSHQSAFSSSVREIGSGGYKERCGPG